jgi:hypothetical protein
VTYNALNAPWTLHFDSDGTEDVAIVCDASGADLVTSRKFWLPEDDDLIPPTLAAMWTIAAAPKLLAALKGMLDAAGGLPITILPGPFYDALQVAQVAIAEAERGPNAAAEITCSIAAGPARNDSAPKAE